MVKAKPTISGEEEEAATIASLMKAIMHEDVIYAIKQAILSEIISTKKRHNTSSLRVMAI